MRPDSSAQPAAAVHATAVSIDGRAILIVGPSRAGKSRLAVALIEASTPTRRIDLIGDDRILLAPSVEGLTARPHPRVAGFIERRGLGIVAMAHEESAPVAAIVDLGGGTSTVDYLAGACLPWLALVSPFNDRSRRDIVLGWFAAISRQTHHTHRAKDVAGGEQLLKD